VDFSQNWEFNTTSTIQEIELYYQYSDTVYFGVTNSSEYAPFPSAPLDFHTLEGRINCNDETELKVKLRNTSPFDLNGVLEFQLGDLLELNSPQPSYDSIVGQSVYWSYNDLKSWSNLISQLTVNTPNETYIGEYVSNTVRVFSWYDGELLLINEVEITEQIR
jgi:hypothetical protein